MSTKFILYFKTWALIVLVLCSNALINFFVFKKKEEKHKTNIQRNIDTVAWFLHFMNLLMRKFNSGKQLHLIGENKNRRSRMLYIFLCRTCWFFFSPVKMFNCNICYIQPRKEITNKIFTQAHVPLLHSPTNSLCTVLFQCMHNLIYYNIGNYLDE